MSLPTRGDHRGGLGLRVTRCARRTPLVRRTRRRSLARTSLSSSPPPYREAQRFGEVSGCSRGGRPGGDPGTPRSPAPPREGVGLRPTRCGSRRPGDGHAVNASATATWPDGDRCVRRPRRRAAGVPSRPGGPRGRQGASGPKRPAPEQKVVQCVPWCPADTRGEHEVWARRRAAGDARSARTSSDDGRGATHLERSSPGKQRPGGSRSAPRPAGPGSGSRAPLRDPCAGLWGPRRGG